MARDRLVAMGILPRHRTERELSGLHYPIPLSADFMAELWLPRDLTKNEAARLHTIIDLLVTEPPSEVNGQ